MYHKAVLLEESIRGLNIQPGGNYADLTFGGGGHSNAILEKLKDGKLIAFDNDSDAAANIANDNRLIFVNHNFRYLKNFLRYYNALPLNGILADLGVSSHQFDTAGRGFSTRFDAELDLRMNTSQSLNAQKIVNDYSESELIRIFKTYGELKNAKKIAAVIASARSVKSLNTTFELIDAIKNLSPHKSRNKFMAQVFQALRIEVNDELGALKEMLKQSTEVLTTGGRLVVISYHSLEDRLVKNFTRSGNFEGDLEKDFYGNVLSPFRLVSNRPLVPNPDEVSANPRSRSAKLRIAEKI